MQSFNLKFDYIFYKFDYFLHFANNQIELALNHRVIRISLFYLQMRIFAAEWIHLIKPKTYLGGLPDAHKIVVRDSCSCLFFFSSFLCVFNEIFIVDVDVQHDMYETIIVAISAYFTTKNFNAKLAGAFLCFFCS